MRAVGQGGRVVHDRPRRGELARHDRGVGRGAAEVEARHTLPVDLDHGLLEPATDVGTGERDTLRPGERAAAEQ